MAIIKGTNAGFVTAAPSGDPAASATVLENIAWGLKDTCPADVDIITQVGWYCSLDSGEVDYEVGLYSHDSGNNEPDALLSSSTGHTKANGATGWQIVSGLSWSVTPGTIYWIGLQVDNILGSTATDYANGQTKYARKLAASSLPDPFNAFDTADKILSVYALVELSGGGEETGFMTPSKFWGS